MTADDLTRLRGEYRPVHRKYVGLIDDVRLYLTCRCPIGRNHTEVDRVERAERERDEAWRQANALNHDLSEVAKTLDALRAAVAGLADEWLHEGAVSARSQFAEEITDEQAERLRLRAMQFKAQSERVRALLTEGADDGQ